MDPTVEMRRFGGPMSGMRTVTLQLTTSEIAALRRFVDRVGYGDVYRHAEHAGDGNRAGSASDLETREMLRLIGHLQGALSNAE